MSTLSKGLSMFLLSIMIMALLITTALGFMLGFSHPLPWVLIAALILIPYIHEKIISRNYIHWHQAMSVGNALIDNDHKKLITLINELQNATQYNIDQQRINSAIAELVNYTKYHFEREEELMRSARYPGYEEHRKLHEGMINKMTECVARYQSDPTHAIDDTLSFLKTWLIQHIMHSDRDYMPYLKTSDNV